jgi:hypothetical protein
MRWAFVLQLGSLTDPARQHLEGSVEEVDTGTELRFRSTPELLAFLCRQFELSQQRPRTRHEHDDDWSEAQD